MPDRPPIAERLFPRFSVGVICRSSLLAALVFVCIAGHAAAQDELVVRPPPTPAEEFETDVEPADGRPDGWYNDRDAMLVSPGLFGDKALRFVNDKPGRPARISRAFGLDGSKYAALKLSVWVKVTNILPGEHQGEDPCILIDFLNADLVSDSRGLVGPFNEVTVGEDRWFQVSRVLPVQPTTLDAIMTVGLIGATGQMDVDRLTLELIPRDLPATTDLTPNGDFALGDIKPESWSVDGAVRRTTDSDSGKTALEFGRGRGRALVGLGRTVEDLDTLNVAVKIKSQGLRSTNAAAVSLYFTDERGGTIVDRTTEGVIRWGGSRAGSELRATVRVPIGARGAVVQAEKLDDAGITAIESVSVTSPDADTVRWTPRSVPVEDGSDEWPEFQPIDVIEPGSVLDASSFGLTTPKPPLKVAKGKLVDANDKPVRLWGVSLLPVAAFPEDGRAVAVAERLYRMGVNVVRFGNLDLATGPGISLIDDARDDTSGIDAESWRRLSRFQAELGKRGLFYSMELHSDRRFRDGDGIPDARRLPPGGGPASLFDPELVQRVDALTKTILTSARPDGLSILAKDPRLAWVTLTGEISLMDADDLAAPFTERQKNILKQLQAESKSGNVRRFRRDLEKERYAEWADLVSESGSKAPLASLGHWRRESDFADVFRGPTIDLVEDRFYWPFPPWAQPGYRSAVFDASRSLAVVSETKRKPDQAYVMAQWCAQSQGAWALPTEAADILLGAFTAYTEDFDALLRRGLAVHPEPWGAAATGTGGKRDIFPIPESLSGMPQALAMMPHVASMLRRDRVSLAAEKARPARPAAKKPAPRRGVPLPQSLPGWNPSEGVVRIETPHTVGMAGRIGATPQETGDFGEFRLEFADDFGVIVVSSANAEPIAQAKRLLLTVLGRAAPTGLRYKDAWQKEVADPGRPPLRIEPVKGRFVWKGKGRVIVHQVDNSGKRAGFATIEREGDATAVTLDLAKAGPHWEIEIER